MLYDICTYYRKSEESGIASMNCKINACLHNPISGKTKYWPEVKNYYQYIDKCYSIAQEFPVEELRHEYYDAKFQSKKALEQVQLKVTDALNLLNEKDLNHMMGYTPISHVREQLIELYNSIDHSIRNFPRAMPASSRKDSSLPRKSILARIFG